MEIYTDLFNPTFLKEHYKRPQLPENTTVTMAYIPLQESLKTYSEEEGLKNGTIFPTLNKEFSGRMVKKI